ncbi:MAG TPA: RagB/SusD family nutrient uptake outer membrane protein [Gemmatimonadales bacterium]|nr:RagB/SusD family nutrient uptake outer membrane protein [Gemmatimonadales bacterium]
MTRGFNRVLAAAAALFLLLATGGCTDTTVEPESTITEANIFTDPNSYEAFVAKIYAGLAVSGQQGPAGLRDIQGIDEGFSQYLRLYWQLQELPTDEAVIAWGDVGIPEMNTQQWASSNPFVVAMYYRIFFQVMMANQFLRETTDEKLTERSVADALRARIQGFRDEARFLRALSYWHGVDLFANIPLVTEADALGLSPPQQATRTQLYDFIVTELIDLQGRLASPGVAGYGRATNAAAAMLLAKVYLNAGVYTGTPRYAEALAASEAVIAGPFSLSPVYRNNFLADNNTSPEIVFPIVQDGDATKSFGGTTFLVHAACGGAMAPASLGVDGCWAGLRLKEEAFNFYAAGDQRASYFFTAQPAAISRISNFGEGVPAPKFANVTSTGDPGSNLVHPDTDFPVFRLAEAYLTYAEAHLRGGGGSRAQALAYVNALRQRAGVADITDAELTLDFILAERGRELLWEAHRRTDLVRYGLFTGGAYIWSWKGGTAAGTATESFRDLYPLPASELVANPNLTQNPGY